MTITWGILGTGKIAKRFAADLQTLPEATLIGAAGRNFQNTESFCRDFGGHAFHCVDELLSSDVQIIYIATPHPDHFPMTMKALAAGKSVLCEKPFSMNVREASEMITFAREKKLFLMEAMWTRFFPAIEEVLHLVKEGAIGELVKIESCFGFHSEFDPQSRLYDKALGGGSIPDIGIYCLAFTRMLVEEEPIDWKGKADFASTGVDVSAVWEQKFSSGIVSTGRSTILEVLSNEATITGTSGEIRIPKFWCPKEFFLNGVKKEFQFSGMGLHFEAQEVMECLKRNLTESPKQSLEKTLSVMKWMETLEKTISSR